VILTEQYEFEKVESPDQTSILSGVIPEKTELPSYIPHLNFIHYVSDIFEVDENSLIKPTGLSSFELNIEMKISSLNFNNGRYNTIPGMENSKSSVVSKKEYVFNTYEEAILKHKEANANK
jgi:hypothetical protein